MKYLDPDVRNKVHQLHGSVAPKEMREISLLLEDAKRANPDATLSMTLRDLLRVGVAVRKGNHVTHT
jgi:hypothetical protein